jgi:hypothetical protein
MRARPLRRDYRCLKTQVNAVSCVNSRFMPASTSGAGIAYRSSS